MGGPSRTRSRLILAAILLVQAGGVALVTAALIKPLAPAHWGDWRIYERYSRNLLRGDLPGASFAMEYPPAALVPLTLPRLVLPGGADAPPGAYHRSLFAFNLLWAALATVAVARTASAIAGDDRAGLRAAAATSMLVVASSLILPFRYDAFPMMLAAFAVMCAVTRRPTWAGLWLGLGIAAKLYPVVFVPAVAIYFLRAGRNGRRDAARVVVASAVPGLLCLVPYALLRTTAFANFLHYHTLRGLQIESTWAGVVMLAKLAGVTTATVVHNFGAEHVAGPWADVLKRIQPPVAAAGLLAATALAWRWMTPRRADGSGAAAELPASPGRQLVRACLAVLLVFLLTNKVFSTQFVVWPIPLVAVAPAVDPRLRRLPVLMFLVTALTMHGFPYDYLGLVHMNAAPVLFLNARNALVAAMLVAVVWGAGEPRRHEGTKHNS